MDLADEGRGGGPVDATVGDAHAVAQGVLGLGEGLVAGGEVALQHRTHDGAVAGGGLNEEGAKDVGLQFGFLGRVVVRAIDEDGGREAGAGELFFGLDDVRGRVIGAAGPAAQHDVAVGVATGHDHGGCAVEVDAKESLRLGGGLDGVEGGFQGAVGAVFKAERHRESGGHLAVGL